MKAPFTFLGVTKQMPVNVVLNGKAINSETWDQDIFIERPEREQEYVLRSHDLKDKKVRVVYRRDWDNVRAN